MNALRRHLVVTGMPGTGKSTLTATLAQQFGVERRDSDVDINTLFGTSGKIVAERDGVAALHHIESAVLLGALAAPTPLVIAAAGSVIDDPVCRSALEHTADLFVLITTEPKPVPGNRHRRPIGTDEVAVLVAQRMPLWREHAAAMLDADRSIVELVTLISTRLQQGVVR